RRRDHPQCAPQDRLQTSLTKEGHKKMQKDGVTRRDRAAHQGLQIRKWSGESSLPHPQWVTYVSVEGGRRRRSRAARRKSLFGRASSGREGIVVSQLEAPAC